MQQREDLREYTLREYMAAAESQVNRAVDLSVEAVPETVSAMALLSIAQSLIALNKLIIRGEVRGRGPGG